MAEQDDPTLDAADPLDAAGTAAPTASHGGRRTRPPWKDRSPRERGVVLIWFALMLIMLMAFAGFAVDLSNWWLQAEKLQRAADAGAHAGVVFLPGDLAGATTVANAEMKKNGYTTSGGGANATSVVSQEPNPNRLRVSLETTVPSYFVGLLGIDDITLTRDAVAEYIAPVPMGSPENKLGNDPSRGQNAPQFWINVAGPASTKKSGDRYQAKNCSNSDNGGHAPAGCVSGVNTEYSETGYFFSLKVTNRPAGEPLNIQVYDPAMVYNGDTCGATAATNGNQAPVIYPTAAELTTLQGVYGADANVRYAGGLTQWCTGDQDISGQTNKTTFIVREPDATPWSDTDNPVVTSCTTTMPSYSPKRTSGGGAKTVFELLNPAGNNPEAVIDGKAPWTFAEVYRRNVTICSIPAASVKTGEYILQVRTNATTAAPLAYSASVNDGGHNRMSIFAGFGETGLQATNGSAVTINARGRLPIYANADQANTTFYLARVLPYDAGRTLRITLYDMGDASSPGVLQILPPEEKYNNLTTFSGCSFSRNDVPTLPNTNGSTCTMSNVSSSTGFDARSVNVDIPIPNNYSCNSASPTGCWIKVRAAFPSGVSDTTTWSAAILGNPIRLVE